MAKSMTGFGTGKVNRENWQCTTEIRSVNNRFLDVTIRLPNGFQHFSSPLKLLIQNVCQRGKVDCSVTISAAEQGSDSLYLNAELADNYGTLLEEFRTLTQIPVSVGLSDLLKVQDLIQRLQPDPESDFFSALIHQSLEIALAQLKNMRVKEGLALLTDIQKRLSTSTSLLNEVDAIAQELPCQHYLRLCQRLASLDGHLEINEDRVHQEIALLVERGDITEEIIRLRTHLEHMESVLLEEEVGRRADFLLQECNREINTIASKSNNAPISQLVVEIKGQFEKIREQVQNIE